MKVYQFNDQYKYLNKKISYNYYSNGPINKARQIVLLGTVQIKTIPKRIALNSPAGTVVIQGAPHWKAEKDGSDIPLFMYTFTESVLNKVIKNVNSDKALRIIADSQAAPGLINYAFKNKNLNIKEIILLQPLGLNQYAFGNNSKSASKEFNKRLMLNFRHQIKWLFTDFNLIYNHFLMFFVLFNNKLNGVDNHAQYSAGLMHNAATDLKKLSSYLRVKIILGKDDKLFPHKELLQTIYDNNIKADVKLVPHIPHSPLSTKAGQKLLKQAYK